MIFPVPLPDSRTAFIHWVSFCANVWLRAIRAYFGHEIAASAIMAFCNPPPSTPATARANTRPGNARNTSETRISTVSVRPPTQPQVTPTAVPRVVMTATSKSVEKILARLPAMTRDSISRPYRSVPRGWALVGACLAMSRFWRYGSWGVRYSEKKEQTIRAIARTEKRIRRAFTVFRLTVPMEVFTVFIPPAPPVGFSGRGRGRECP